MPKAKLDLKSLSDQDLKDKLSEEALRMKKITFSHAVTPIENPMQIRFMRREIARIQTELRRREQGF
ncbi:50S ribosomal protein L29 [Chitinophaga deserti]|uniref:50S ribosomal protein L29 n=1 Tax=Chitinophaga deserti TaxID=2164099 RepID=UPI000D6D5B7B|nr:50S ribosomal protein L29 [Chitinophaga deserti]